jgi:hypothetical protein
LQSRLDAFQPNLMQRSNHRPTIGKSAARGAIAGIIGGAAMTAAERVILPRLPDRRRPRIVPWDERLSSAADAMGWEMSPRARTTLGITTQLLYAALLGAGYAALTSRKPSRAARELADAALVFAASLLAPELPRHQPPRRRRRTRVERLRHRVIEPLTAPKVFGRTTTLALRALQRAL